MPIRSEDKARYPANWKQIRTAILERASHRCEFCGVKNHAVGYRKNGRFIPITTALRDAGCEAGHEVACDNGTVIKIIRIVLTIAHLDHTPENCDPNNLRALCQRCHLHYDIPHHQRTFYRTRRIGKAMGDLFDAYP